MLKLTLAMRGAATKIELGGVDVSKYFDNVEVKASVNSVPTVQMQYRGVVIVEGEPGQIVFREQPRHSGEVKEDVVVNLLGVGV